MIDDIVHEDDLEHFDLTVASAACPRTRQSAERAANMMRAIFGSGREVGWSGGNGARAARVMRMFRRVVA